MNNMQSIGVFDSGLGGLTVYKQLKRSLPEEHFIYFGDTAHVPYGNKSPNTIIRYCLKIVQFFEKQKVKLIIIACNTASAVALEAIRKETKLPILNVITPSIEEALKITRNNKIAIIGTQTTIQSNAYEDQIKQINPQTKVFAKACPLFVPIIEEGMFHHPIAQEITKMYLKDFIKNSFDTIILGCTHYPLIKRIINTNILAQQKIIDSSLAVADYTAKFLKNNKLIKKGKNNHKKDEFYITDETKKFDILATQFLNYKIYNINKIEL